MIGAARSIIRKSLPFLLVIVAVGVPLAYGIQMTVHKGYPSQIAVLSRIFITPFMFIFPLIAGLLGCWRVYTEVGHRFASLHGARQSMRRYLAGRLLYAALIPAAAYFIYAALVFLVAYYLWPEIGNPGVDPANYAMTTAEAVQAEVSDTSYSQLLEFGTPVYGLAYATWLGVSAGFYATAAALCLVVMRKRLAAIALPSAVFLAQSVLAIAVSGPQSALVFSVFPFGLTQLPIAAAVAPQLVLDVAVIVFVVYVFVNVRRKGYLT
jgi:hypothetical protein